MAGKRFFRPHSLSRFLGITATENCVYSIVTCSVLNCIVAVHFVSERILRSWAMSGVPWKYRIFDNNLLL